MKATATEPELTPVTLELTGEEAAILAEIGNALYGTDVGQTVAQRVAREVGFASESDVAELTYQLYSQIRREQRR